MSNNKTPIASTKREISFVIWGDPVAQPRPRFFRAGAGIRSYDPAKEDKKSFAYTASQHAPETPLTCPVVVKATFYLKRPKLHYRTGKNSDILKADAPHIHSKRPDVDNFYKFFDCFEGIFWKDDAQVWDLHIKKVYSDKPRTEIKLEFYD